MSDQTVSIPADHADHMDRMYRYTRHVYDATRRYYLFGRDRLLREMKIASGDRVLEMGCGTARNLIKLARIHPNAKLFGLDASQSMLDTAQQSLHHRQLDKKVTLRYCLAEQLDHRATFSLDQQFDVIFFSYSLSMMPTWPAAIDAALNNLKPGGEIYIVDFWDQAGLPRAFAWLLKRWLALFHVHYRPELLEHLQQMQRDGKCRMTLQSLGGRYAYIATVSAMVA
jgi:S-adenosylmethionine-diacylgycerolhomoserine-N-methlytransferase